MIIRVTLSAGPKTSRADAMDLEPDREIKYPGQGYHGMPRRRNGLVNRADSVCCEHRIAPGRCEGWSCATTIYSMSLDVDRAQRRTPIFAGMVGLILLKVDGGTASMCPRTG